MSLEPWEYHAGIDTAETWPVFTAYLNSSPPRSLKEVAFCNEVSYQTIYRWARDGLWKERALAWDKHLQAVHAEEVESYVKASSKEVAEKHLLLIKKALALTETELLKLETKAYQTASNVVKPQQLIRFMTESVKLERLVRGESTEKVDVGLDLSQLSTEELEAWDQLLKKAAKP